MARFVVKGYRSGVGTRMATSGRWRGTGATRKGLERVPTSMELYFIHNGDLPARPI